MKAIKYFIFGLLFLLSLTSIFNEPGTNNLPTYQYVTSHYINFDSDKKNTIGLIDFYIKYPPGIHLTMDYLFKNFRPDPLISVFYRQNIWLVSKIILYIFYILTWFSIIYLIKANKLKISYLDASLAYFGSVSILIASVGQVFFDILAAPFLVLSLNYLLQRKMVLSSLVYLGCLFINWNLFVIAPIFAITSFKQLKVGAFSKIALTFNFLLVPFCIFLINFFGKTENFNLLSKKLFLNPGGYPYLANSILDYIVEHGKMDNLGWGISAFILLIMLISMVFLLKGPVFLNLRRSRKVVSYSILGIISTIFMTYLYTNNPINFLQIPFLLFLLGLIVLFVRKLEFIHSITREVFLGSILFLLFLQLLFFPDLSQGGLLWILLVSVLLYIVNQSNFTKLFLILINLLTFMIVFLSNGVGGYPSVLGTYFDLFKIIFSASLIFFIIWYTNCFYRTNFFSEIDFNKFKIFHLKWFIVAIMFLINISLLPVVGSPDHVAWTEYTLAATSTPNPFLAQTLVDQRYPPLSTVILGAFANGWKILIGVSKDYATATKLSIFTFYLLTIFVLIKFSSKFSEKIKLSNLDKILVILTTFSLVIQTQGFADVNIHLIPTLFGAIFFLIKRKYFLSGILMGITVSIKWQPVILLPLFAATLLNLEELKFSIKRSFIFALGFSPMPIVSWILVIINPGGWDAFHRSTDYLLHGAAMLSGQGLNLNWIVTYIMHIYQYNGVESLSELEGLNRQVGTNFAPYIFQGTLFIIIWAVITIRYWLKQKKDIVNFLAAAVMVFFTHHQLNKSAYEKHIFYVAILMLFLYLVRPTVSNRMLLILFDLMVVINLIFFYGFTGPKDINRLFFGFDLTIIFSIYYLIIFVWVIWKYFKNEIFVR